MAEGSLIIKEVELLRLQPGDILFVNTGSVDPGEIEDIADAINSALTHVGLEEKVSALLHDGNISLQLVRAE